MEIRTVSVKELRENFGQLKKGLEKGLNYILIYRSRPLAEIRPIKKRESRVEREKRIERNVQKVKKLAGGFKFGKGLTPEQINKMIDAEYEKDVRKMLS